MHLDRFTRQVITIVNSKQKGKRAELALSHKLNELGFNTRRTAQYNGKEQGSLADLVGIPNVHIECKHNERLNIHDAMAQADRDCADGDTPMVFHKKNNKPWLVTMHLEDWASREHIFAKEWEESDV